MQQISEKRCSLAFSDIPLPNCEPQKDHGSKKVESEAQYPRLSSVLYMYNMASKWPTHSHEHTTYKNELTSSEKPKFAYLSIYNTSNFIGLNKLLKYK